MNLPLLKTLKHYHLQPPLESLIRMKKLEILSSLIKECINRHAPLKLTKVTRPPAPWLKDPAIAELKEQRDRLRSDQPRETSRKEFCHLRNQKKFGK